MLVLAPYKEAQVATKGTPCLAWDETQSKGVGAILYPLREIRTFLSAANESLDVRVMVGVYPRVSRHLSRENPNPLLRTRGATRCRWLESCCTLVCKFHQHDDTRFKMQSTCPRCQREDLRSTVRSVMRNETPASLTSSQRGHSGQLAVATRDNSC